MISEIPEADLPYSDVDKSFGVVDEGGDGGGWMGAETVLKEYGDAGGEEEGGPVFDGRGAGDYRGLSGSGALPLGLNINIANGGGAYPTIKTLDLSKVVREGIDLSQPAYTVSPTKEPPAAPKKAVLKQPSQPKARAPKLKQKHAAEAQLSTIKEQSVMKKIRSMQTSYVESTRQVAKKAGSKKKGADAKGVQQHGSRSKSKRPESAVTRKVVKKSV